MIKTKSGGESQNASLIKPINGDSYCISKTHLRVEVNTFVMVMIMALNARAVICSQRTFSRLTQKDISAAAWVIKARGSQPSQLNREKCVRDCV